MLNSTLGQSSFCITRILGKNIQDIQSHKQYWVDKERVQRLSYHIYTSLLPHHTLNRIKLAYP